MTTATIAMLIVGTALSQQPNVLNVKTAAGTEFLEALNATEAEIESADSSRITLRVSGQDAPLRLRKIDVQVIDESKVGDKPVTFESRHKFRSGNKVKVGRYSRQVYIVIPKLSGSERYALREAGIELSPEEQPPLQAVDDPLIVPTADQVKDVLKLDTKAKRDKFDLLREKDRTVLLLVAGNIAGLKGAHMPDDVIGTLWPLELHTALFDQQKLNKWLNARAEKNGVAEFLKISQAPEESHDKVRLHFGMLSRFEMGRALECAEQIKNSGLSQIVDAQKEFVEEHGILFGVK